MKEWMHEGRMAGLQQPGEQIAGSLWLLGFLFALCTEVLEFLGWEYEEHHLIPGMNVNVQLLPGLWGCCCWPGYAQGSSHKASNMEVPLEFLSPHPFFFSGVWDAKMKSPLIPVSQKLPVPLSRAPSVEPACHNPTMEENKISPSSTPAPCPDDPSVPPSCTPAPPVPSEFLQAKLPNSASEHPSQHTVLSRQPSRTKIQTKFLPLSFNLEKGFSTFLLVSVFETRMHVQGSSSHVSCNLY